MQYTQYIKVNIDIFIYIYIYTYIDRHIFVYIKKYVYMYAKVNKYIYIENTFVILNTCSFVFNNELDTRKTYRNKSVQSMGEHRKWILQAEDSIVRFSNHILVEKMIGV